MTVIRQIIGWCICLATFAIYLITLMILSVGASRPLRRQRRRSPKGISLLITGRFDSLNWGQSHVLPLAHAKKVRQLIALVDGPLPQHDKILSIIAPVWLRRILGRVPARSLWVQWIAWRQRPDAILGYHFFPAALSVLWAARLTGAKAFYSVTAGPVELVHGGVATESSYVPRTNRLPRLLSPLALRLCGFFDGIIVRGHQAQAYIEKRVPTASISIIPGSIKPSRFNHFSGQRDYDLVFVGRLVPVKQPEQLLRIIALLARRRVDLRALVIGDGPLKPALIQKAEALGLTKTVEFAGHIERVEEVLTRSRIFLLTSRSEGLSIAMAEAMAAGVVPVVANVGDLGELVQDGTTGYLITPNNFEAYANRIDELLNNQPLWKIISDNARLRATENNALSAVAGRWDRHLSNSFSAAWSTHPPTSDQPLPKSIPISPRGRLWTNESFRFWQNRVPVWAKRLISRPLKAIGPRRLLGPEYARRAKFVSEAEDWPAARSRAYQLEQLRHICSLAYNHSSYYRNLFLKSGFDPRDLRRIEDLLRLPPCDKEVIRENLREMCVCSPDTPGVDMISTGGTSGIPLHFYMQANRAAIEYAYLTASWRRVGYRLGDPMVVFRGKIVQSNRHGLRHEYDPILRCHFYSIFHMTDDDMYRYLEHIRALGPCYMHVYPSAAVNLAHFIRRSGLAPLNNIRGVIAESEMTTPEQRALVEGVFNCRYFSCYGHSEKLVFASECEHSSNYHIWPTYGYFELQDAADQPVTTVGQRGEIVATGFINKALPFIRYRTGDSAIYRGELCEACGREHTIIQDIRGHRIQEVLIANDGSEIPWVAINMHDDTFINVRQFQFLQERPGQADLLIVSSKTFDESDSCKILHNLNRKLENRIAITIKYVDNIPLSPRGKAIYVKQNIPLIGCTA